MNALRRETDLLLFKTKLRHIIREFVSEDAPRQVNLRDEIRQKTEKSAAEVLNRLAKVILLLPHRHRVCFEQSSWVPGLSSTTHPDLYYHITIAGLQPHKTQQ